MSDVTNWSPIDDNNNSAPPDGAPEGMSASAVNDTMRAYQGSVRRLAEDGTWFDWGDTYTFVDSDTFQVPGDRSSTYVAGRRVRCVQSGGTIYGTIASVAVSANTDVTVTFDSGNLVSGSLTVSVGPDQEAIGAGGLGTAAFEDVGTAVGDVVQLEDVSGSAGLPAVDGSQLTGLASGSLIKLNTKTASASATLDFTENSAWFTSYRAIVLDMQDIRPTNLNVNCWVRVRRSGSWVTGTDYRDCNLGVAGDGSTFSDRTDQNRHGVAGEIDNDAGGQGLSCTTRITQLAAHQAFHSNCVWRRNPASFGPITANNVWCQMITSGQIDGVRVQMSAGTIAVGSVTLYGVV